MTGLLSALVLLVAAAGPAPLVTAEGIPVDRAGVSDDAPRFGVQLEAGVPDGIGAAVSTNPTKWLRVQLAGLTNIGGGGVRVGVVLSPLAAVTKHAWPILGVDAGYFFNGDARWIPNMPESAALQTALSRVSYAFANAHLGVELGTRAFAMVLRGGLSYLDMTLGDPTAELGRSTTLVLQGLSIRGVFPSARVGFLFTFS